MSSEEVTAGTDYEEDYSDFEEEYDEDDFEAVTDVDFDGVEEDDF